MKFIFVLILICLFGCEEKKEIADFSLKNDLEFELLNDEINFIQVNPEQLKSEIVVYSDEQREKALNRIDFKITNVTYKTAGLTFSYDCNIPIQNDAILVDYIDDHRLEHTIFEHNGKAYQFAYETNNNLSAPRIYSIFEFSPTTEKWTKLTTFNFSGFIYDAVYDGNGSVYLYKHIPNVESFSITKLNMNNFSEVTLSLPSTDIILNPILFAYQDNLYMLSGLNNTNGTITVRNQKYKYSSNSNSWSQLSNAAFSDLPLVSSSGSGKCSYLFHGNNIYITYGIVDLTYKISSSLAVTSYQHIFSFEHSNAIIGKQLNYNQYFFNIITQQSVPITNDNLFDYNIKSVSKVFKQIMRKWTRGFYFFF